MRELNVGFFLVARRKSVKCSTLAILDFIHSVLDVDAPPVVKGILRLIARPVAVSLLIITNTRILSALRLTALTLRGWEWSWWQMVLNITNCIDHEGLLSSFEIASMSGAVMVSEKKRLRST